MRAQAGPMPSMRAESRRHSTNRTRLTAVANSLRKRFAGLSLEVKEQATRQFDTPLSAVYHARNWKSAQEVDGHVGGRGDAQDTQIRIGAAPVNVLGGWAAAREGDHDERRRIMNKLEFRPRKALLFFWLLWTLLGGLPVCGVIAAIASSEKSSPLHGFWGILISAAAGVYLVLYFFSIRYTLDDRYVMKASGVLWKVRRSIPLEKITNIDVRQGPVERLLGFGRIWVFTPSTGASVPEEKLLGVDHPYEMKQTIIDYVEAAKTGVSTSETNGGPEAHPKQAETAAILSEILSTLQRIEGKMGEKENRPEV